VKGKLDVIPVSYGYVSLLGFLNPVIGRKRRVENVLQQLNAIRADYPADKCHMTIIAHSFGTYIVTRILSEHSYFVIGDLLLCGSIAPYNVDWTKIRNQTRSRTREFGKGTILNDCATLDVWPVIARVASWGFDSTGTYGIRRSPVVDRFHSIHHSSYFERSFVDKYWKPFVHESEIVTVNEGESKRGSPIYFRLFELPLKTLAALILVGLLARAVPWQEYLFSRTDPETQRHTDLSTAAGAKGNQASPASGSSLALPARVGAASARSTYSVGVSVPSKLPALGEHEVKEILADASKMLQKNSGHVDTDDDVACNVAFTLKGSVGKFGSTDTPEIVDRDHIDAVHRVDSDRTDVDFHVKVVEKINFCRPGISALFFDGCSFSPPGFRSIIVVHPKMHKDRFGQAVANFPNHLLWSHEFGHLTGLGHRDDDQRALMTRCDLRTQFSNVSDVRVRVKPDECRRLLSGPGSPPPEPLTGAPVCRLP
jgi:hypothetical protein